MTSRNDADVIEETWDALVARNAPPALFRYGDTLADVTRGRVRVLTAELMGWTIARHVQLERVSQKGVASPTTTPSWLERKTLVVGDERLPELARVSLVPVLAPDGSLRDVPGYDAATRVWYEPDVALPAPVPERPEEAQVLASRDFVLRELFGDFPFETESDRTNAVALFLLPFARGLVGDSPTPLHLVSKPDVGAGATTLVQTLLAAGVGAVPAPIEVGTSADEVEKVLLAKARAGADVIFLDNVTTLRRQSSALAQAITGRAIEGRVLGTSQVARVPLAPVWCATGNNPVLAEELQRRTCPIRLVTWSESPWERGGFRHRDVIGYAWRERGKLRWAALTILRGWLAAGTPGGPDVGSSFGGWARVLGGVAAWLGLGGFMANRAVVVDSEDRESWRELVAFAESAFGGGSFAARDLWEALTRAGGAAAEVVADATRNGASPVRSVGMILHHNRGKVVGGSTIDAVTGSRPRRWYVRRVTHEVVS